MDLGYNYIPLGVMGEWFEDIGKAYRKTGIIQEYEVLRDACPSLILIPVNNSSKVIHIKGFPGQSSEAEMCITGRIINLKQATTMITGNPRNEPIDESYETLPSFKKGIVGITIKSKNDLVTILNEDVPYLMVA